MCDHIFNRGEKSIPGERFLEKIRPVYDVDIIKVLMGPRRSGKSVILSMIADEVEADADHKIYILTSTHPYTRERVCVLTRAS